MRMFGLPAYSNNRSIPQLARPRGFEPLTSASGGIYSLVSINYFNAFRRSTWRCVYFVIVIGAGLSQSFAGI